MSWFSGSGSSKKQDPKQIARQGKKDIRQNQRELDRELRALERAEAQCQRDIKQLAKRGENNSAKHMARELIRIRKAKEKLIATRSQLSCVSTRTTTMAATGVVAGAMATAASAMASTNDALNLPQLQQTMMQYERESQRMEMTDEMLDDMFDDEEADEEADEILSQVADEIGLDLAGMTPTAPTKATPSLEPQEEESVDNVSDAELNRLIAQLNS